MDKWINYAFQSGCHNTAEFKAFAGDFHRHVKKLCRGYVVKPRTGHFFVSGFISKDGRCWYYSVSDVRFFNNEWHDRVLIRTAENDRDFSGGVNRYCALSEIADYLK
jgi:hypothetical protein